MVDALNGPLRDWMQAEREKERQKKKEEVANTAVQLADAAKEIAEEVSDGPNADTQLTSRLRNMEEAATRAAKECSMSIGACERRNGELEKSNRALLAAVTRTIDLLPEFANDVALLDGEEEFRDVFMDKDKLYDLIETLSNEMSRLVVALSEDS